MRTLFLLALLALPSACGPSKESLRAKAEEEFRQSADVRLRGLEKDLEHFRERMRLSPRGASGRFHDALSEMEEKRVAARLRMDDMNLGSAEKKQEAQEALTRALDVFEGTLRDGEKRWEKKQ